MITMKEWLELVDYKITEGSEYGWDCYGPNSYSLESFSNGYNFGIVFSTKTQKVYEVSVCDYINNRAYRMINPNNVEKHRKEATERGISLNQAWDEVEYVDLEVNDDFIQKGLSIKNGKDYDTSVLVTIDLSDDLLLQAALEAHKQNITLNEYINLILTKRVSDEKEI
jgi:predicted HicB family RNase H-like nuclease